MERDDLEVRLHPCPAGWYGEVLHGERVLYATGARKTKGEAERECRVFAGARCRPVVWQGRPGWWETT